MNGEAPAGDGGGFLLQDAVEVYFQTKQSPMIYLQDSNEIQAIWFPMPSRSAAVSVTLDLHSTTGLENIVTETTGTWEGDYFRAALNPVSLSLAPGEWEYTISFQGNTLARGVLAVLSDELSYRKIYNKNITYEQYRAEE